MRNRTELPGRVIMGEAVSVEVDAGKEADLVEGQAAVAGAHHVLLVWDLRSHQERLP